MIGIGQSVKVFLRGESPWATVVKIIDESHMKAKIDNHPVNTNFHGVVFGDIESFELKEMVKGCLSWEHCL